MLYNIQDSIYLHIQDSDTIQWDIIELLFTLLIYEENFQEKWNCSWIRLLMEFKKKKTWIFFAMKKILLWDRYIQEVEALVFQVFIVPFPHSLHTINNSSRWFFKFVIESICWESLRNVFWTSLFSNKVELN